MNRFVVGRSFAVNVAAILLYVLAHNLLKKKEKSAIETDAENASTARAYAFGFIFPSGIEREQCNVFLSFRRSDLLDGFADRLYSGLAAAAGVAPIFAFKDDEDHLGEEFGTELFDVVTQCKISIPIISPNYASSKWCLHELIHMMDCRERTRHMVIPIFYEVNPSDGRCLTGSVGEAFQSCKKRFDAKDIGQGQEALRLACSIKGWVSKNFSHRPPEDFVQIVVKEVRGIVQRISPLNVPGNLVGIDDHVKKIMRLMDTSSDHPQFIGIHGMGGIGKTTLAKVIYNKLLDRFEYCAFLADIRERVQCSGILSLQNELISLILGGDYYRVCTVDEGIHLIKKRVCGRKVLIILDDVDHTRQLDALAGKHDWFGLGSVIIVTARDKYVLYRAGVMVDDQFNLKELAEDQSLLLFSKHAFGSESPPDEFKDLSRYVAAIMGGLPLTLEVIGSFLNGKGDQGIWEETLKQLEDVPPEEVLKKLKISYDALDYLTQKIFLDIACFCIGTNMKIACYMWDDLSFFPHIAIKKLTLGSLIKVGDDFELIMHDQLRDLGRIIVYQEDRDPKNRSRLWDYEEASKALEGQEQCERIQALCLYKEEGRSDEFGVCLFEKLPCLEFLRVHGIQLIGDFRGTFFQLRWLELEDCPNSSFAANFCSEKLIILKLSGCSVPRNIESIMIAKQLKVLNLSHCDTLKSTLDLSAFKSLEMLILCECAGLEEIDSSIREVKYLVSLDLRKCGRLKRLPKEVGELEELTELLLDDTAIQELPATIGYLKKLERLSVRRCESLAGLPSSMASLVKLKQMFCGGCSLLKGIPNSIGKLESLTELDLSFTGITALPESIGDLQSLQILSLQYTRISCLPESIHRLSSLQRLDVSNCSQLKGLTELPSGLTLLRVTCQSPTLPRLSHLTHLQYLLLRDCKFLECIPEIPSTTLQLHVFKCDKLKFLLEPVPQEYSEQTEIPCPQVSNSPSTLDGRVLDGSKYLEGLKIESCNSIEMLDLSHLNHLRKLNAIHCKNLVEIRGLHMSEFLKEIDISHCESIKRLDLSQLNHLKQLKASSCKNLVEIQGPFKFLEKLDVLWCKSIERLDLSQLDRLKLLTACSCENLVEIRGHDKSGFLEELEIVSCHSIKRLEIPQINGLRRLTIADCENLVEIQAIVRLELLEVLDVSKCKSIISLDLSQFGCLKRLNAKECENLLEIQGLDKLEFLEVLDISLCKSLERLNLSQSKCLKQAMVRECKSLHEIQGLGKLESSDISRCKSPEGWTFHNQLA